MENFPERSEQGVSRKDGRMTPFNAGDAVAAIKTLYPHPIPRAYIPRLGKHAKELLEDGFDPKTICEAMLTAIDRCRPDLTPTFALEIQNKNLGRGLSYQAWQDILHGRSRSLSPAEIVDLGRRLDRFTAGGREP